MITEEPNEQTAKEAVAEAVHWCIDCVHATNDPTRFGCGQWVCNKAFYTPPVNLVTGEVQDPRPMPCNVARSWGEQCGPTAKLFKPKVE